MPMVLALPSTRARAVTGSIGATEPAKSHVGHTGHRSQYHRGINGDGAELERGQCPGHVAQRAVMGTSRRVSIERNKGRDNPMTLLGSPSMPSMKGADLPSRVNAPATSTASPVVTYR